MLVYDYDNDTGGGYYSLMKHGQQSIIHHIVYVEEVGLSVIIPNILTSQTGRSGQKQPTCRKRPAATT